MVRRCLTQVRPSPFWGAPRTVVKPRASSPLFLAVHNTPFLCLVPEWWYDTMYMYLEVWPHLSGSTKFVCPVSLWHTHTRTHAHTHTHTHTHTHYKQAQAFFWFASLSQQPGQHSTFWQRLGKQYIIMCSRANSVTDRWIAIYVDEETAVIFIILHHLLWVGSGDFHPVPVKRRKKKKKTKCSKKKMRCKGT